MSSARLKTILWKCAVLGVVAGLMALTGVADAAMVLRRGNGGEPDTLDPTRSSAEWENNILGDIFMGLTADSADGRAVPGSAARWDISADGKTYIFHLRKNLVWSDGVPLTAADFVYSYRRLLDPAIAAQYAPALYPLINGEAVATGKARPETLGVRAIDDHTLEMKFSAPVPYLPQLLTLAATFPVPRHVIEKYGAAWTQPGHMVGNGAFSLVEWKPQSYVKLVRNPRFYDVKNVRLDAVYYYPGEDSNAALKQFRAGELDAMNGFPSRQLDWLRRNMAAETRVAPWLGTYYYALNNEKYPYSDRRVRLALSMAIERELITDKLLKYGVIPAYGLAPQGIANYGQGARAYFASWPREKRIAEARRLLMSAGFGPDKPLIVTIKYNTSQDHKKIALAVAANWKKIGVVTRLFNVEAKVLYADLRIGDFEAGRAAWVADFNDPQNFLFLLDSATGKLNYSNYKNPRFDALLRQASTMLDLQQRAVVLRQAEQLAMDDQPIIPIYFYVSRNLVAKRVHGWVDNIVDRHRSRYLWLDPLVSGKAN